MLIAKPKLTEQDEITPQQLGVIAINLFANTIKPKLTFEKIV